MPEGQNPDPELLEGRPAHDLGDGLADPISELLGVLRGLEAEFDGDEDGFGLHAFIIGNTCS